VMKFKSWFHEWQPVLSEIVSLLHTARVTLCRGGKCYKIFVAVPLSKHAGDENV
jgi:hypothetical protein